MKGSTGSSRRLLSILTAVNLRLGMPDEQAVEHARATCRILAEKFSASSLYVSGSEYRAERRARRDAEIFAARRQGRSFGWIEKHFGVTRGHAHAICRSAGVRPDGRRPNSASKQNPGTNETECRN